MATNVRKKMIIVPYGMKREIARALNINERTVGRSLSGEITGKKSAAARRLAETKLKEINQ
jgi:hypothetical protein